MISGAYIVAGIGYGDEGKGHITNYLTWRYGAKLNVRYNGGPQAAHNVCWFDKNGAPRHHTFSQFGAGTPSGASTYLSRHMLIEPLAMQNEGESLERDAGIRDPFSKLYVDRHCPVITPYHAAMNRLKEAERRGNPHGTCGIGFGDAVEDFREHGDSFMLMAHELTNTALAVKKMQRIQETKLERVKEMDLDGLNVDRDLALLKTHPLEFSDRYRAVINSVQLVDQTFLGKQSCSVVFEGAQGALLHQSLGFHPHTTWSDTSMRNATILLMEAEACCDVRRIAVTRSYMTRHGAGPLVTEHAFPRHEEHNPSDNAQGAFRTGDLDLVALKYGQTILGRHVELAVTHAEKIDPTTKICTHYKVPHVHRSYFSRPMNAAMPDGVFDGIAPFHQYESLAHLTKALKEVKPISHPLDAPKDKSVEVFCERVTYHTGIPVRLLSYGSMSNKTVYDEDSFLISTLDQPVKRI